MNQYFWGNEEGRVKTKDEYYPPDTETGVDMSSAQADCSTEAEDIVPVG